MTLLTKSSFDSSMSLSVISVVSNITVFGLSDASYRYTPFNTLLGSILKKFVAFVSVLKFIEFVITHWSLLSSSVYFSVD